MSLVFGLITELVTESYLASRSPGAVLKPQPGFRCEICSLLTYETNNAPSRTRAETAGASRASADDLGPHPITPLLLRSTTTTRPSDHADQRVTTRRDVESGHQSVVGCCTSFPSSHVQQSSCANQGDGRAWEWQAPHPDLAAAPEIYLELPTAQGGSPVPKLQPRLCR